MNQFVDHHLLNLASDSCFYPTINQFILKKTNGTDKKHLEWTSQMKYFEQLYRILQIIFFSDQTSIW